MPCQQVQIEPEDRSRINITGFNVSPSGPKTAAVNVSVQNEAISGDGVQKDVTVIVTVDGGNVDSFNDTIDGGITKDFQMELTGLEPGERTICAKLFDPTDGPIEEM